MKYDKKSRCHEAQEENACNSTRRAVVLKPEEEHLARQHRLLHETAATQHHHITGGFAILKNNHVPGHQFVRGASPYPPPLNDGHDAPLVHQIHQLCMLLPQRHTQYCHSKERKAGDDGCVGVIRTVPQVRHLKALQPPTAGCQYAVWSMLLQCQFCTDRLSIFAGMIDR